MEQLNNKVTGSSLTADQWNQVATELQNVITDAGQALSAGDLAQLSKSVANYVAYGTFYTDSGTAAAYVLTKIGTRRAATSYLDGMEVEFIAGNTNSASPTINVDGLGAVDIAGAASGGEIAAGDYIRLRYNSGTGDFDIVGNTAPSVVDASETVKGVLKLATKVQVDAGTDDLTAVTPLKLKESPQTAAMWVNFFGTGTISINQSFNVDSIADNGVGDYTITFTDAMVDTFYVTSGSTSPGSTSSRSGVIAVQTPLTTSVRINTNKNGDNGSAPATDDYARVSVVVFGNK